MLALKIIRNDFCGYDHPEKVITSVEYYKIDDNLTTKEIEKYIKNKTNNIDTYSSITWEIVEIKEC